MSNPTNTRTPINEREAQAIANESDLMRLAESGGGLIYVSSGSEFSDRASGIYFFQRIDDTNLFFRQYHDGAKTLLALEAFSCPIEGIDYNSPGLIINPKRRKLPPSSIRGADPLIEVLKKQGLWQD